MLCKLLEAKLRFKATVLPVGTLNDVHTFLRNIALMQAMRWDNDCALDEGLDALWEIYLHFSAKVNKGDGAISK